MRRCDCSPTPVLPATVIWVALLFTGSARGSTFTVNTILDLPDDTPGNGLCKSAPPEELCSLRAAVMEANALPGADTIRLPPATYVLSIPPGPVDTDADGDLDITGDLDIGGAVLGLTIIDAGGVDRVLDVLGVSVRLNHLTLIGGQSNDGLTGGAVKNSGVLEIRNSTIANNDGPDGGGGIGNYANLLLERTVVRDNDTATYGGGVMNFGTAEIRDSELRDNSALAGGGAYNTNNGALTFLRTLVEGNSISGSGYPYGGGGLWNGATLVLRDSVLHDNTSDNGAGGGGIYNVSLTVPAAATLVNTTLSHNSAAAGGGAIFNSASISLYSCTLADNSSNYGGGILTSAGYTEVAGTLFGYNPGGNCYGTAITSAFPSHSLDADGTCALYGSGDQSGVDPQLGSFGYHGGPTPSYLLPSSSPAVDAGDPVNGCVDEAAIFLTTDQLGQARPFDGDGDGLSVCDIGAVESSLVFADGFESAGTSAWSSAVP